MLTDWIVTYVTRHPYLKVESVRDVAIRAKSDAEAVEFVRRVMPDRMEDVLVDVLSARKFV